MLKTKIEPKLDPEIDKPLDEEIGICYYCGFSWILRHSPHNCPHCGGFHFKTKFPDGSIRDPATNSWRR